MQFSSPRTTKPETSPNPHRACGPESWISLARPGCPGLLGNSGGFLLAPLFMTALHMPVRRALGTSLALTAAAPWSRARWCTRYLGHIDWTLAFVFGLASVPLAELRRIGRALRMRERSLTLT